ncbi:hypothetical protein POSPLDRAFT_104059 [Postia placenta Mad-698-R]|nr:hypothetical protein POSPLDRAFT_104059 [Postia placenta Mad-698-R]
MVSWCKTFVLGLLLGTPFAAATYSGNACTLAPLGEGQDDTDQAMNMAYWLTRRKMTWDLVEARVDLHGYLNVSTEAEFLLLGLPDTGSRAGTQFKADLPYWMKPENTYRVIFIQSQASWFVITGHDFTVDAHNTGGIIGNGQYWWSWYGNGTRIDGDGRPVALTVYRAARATIAGFRIEGQPFWCNAIAESQDVVYDGMYCNAANADPLYFNQNIVWNTDGIDTFRSDNISLLNFDITLGDDCIAIKGNSTNIYANNITCHGGTGIAFGSLGQYYDLYDNVENITIEDVNLIRLDPAIQPYMRNGVYFKSWTGTTIGFPPAEGGGGPGRTVNATMRNFYLDNVTNPIQLYQTNSGHPGDAPSEYQFSDLTFVNFTGSAATNLPPCPGLLFQDINITAPEGEKAAYNCYNVVSQDGLLGSMMPSVKWLEGEVFVDTDRLKAPGTRPAV